MGVGELVTDSRVEDVGKRRGCWLGGCTCGCAWHRREWYEHGLAVWSHHHDHLGNKCCTLWLVWLHLDGSMAEVCPVNCSYMVVHVLAFQHSVASTNVVVGAQDLQDSVTQM